MSLDVAKKIMKKLIDVGYPTYLVGGCVRDMLRNVEPNDYDIATVAKPNEILNIFKGKVVRSEGEQYGTVLITMENEKYEITTFRKDTNYSDGRHPDNVQWTDDLKQDLSRRDFTINAMAMDIDGNVIDHFGGKQDLNDNTIRCVKSGSESFKEDKLRILRAVRFSSVYGFAYAKTTKQMMNKYSKDIRDYIPAERIRNELVKIFVGDNLYYTLIDTNVIPTVLGVDLNDDKEHTRWEMSKAVLRLYGIVPTLISTKQTKYDYRVALALCLTPFAYPYYVIQKEPNHSATFDKDLLQGVENVDERFLKPLKFSNEERNFIKLLIKSQILSIPTQISGACMLVNKINSQVAISKIYDFWNVIYQSRVNVYFKIIRGRDVLENSRRLVKNVMTDGTCYSLKQLAIDGNDLVELGYEGTSIGEELNAILMCVINSKIYNDREDLLRFAKQHLANISKQRG